MPAWLMLRQGSNIRRFIEACIASKDVRHLFGVETRCRASLHCIRANGALQDLTGGAYTLLPVTGIPCPTGSGALPLARHPNSIVTPHFIPTVYPHIVLSVPIPVTRDPNIVRSRLRLWDLNSSSRGRGRFRPLHYYMFLNGRFPDFRRFHNFPCACGQKHEGHTNQ